MFPSASCPYMTVIGLGFRIPLTVRNPFNSASNDPGNGWGRCWGPMVGTSGQGEIYGLGL